MKVHPAFGEEYSISSILCLFIVCSQTQRFFIGLAFKLFYHLQINITPLYQLIHFVTLVKLDTIDESDENRDNSELRDIFVQFRTVDRDVGSFIVMSYTVLQGRFLGV